VAYQDNMSNVESELNSDNKILLKEIEKIVNQSIKNNTYKIKDAIISFFAKKAVGIFITIIIACFATFGALTYFISTTKENIELKAQVEKLQLDIHKLEQSKNKK
jgi:hypothetical protein